MNNRNKRITVLLDEESFEKFGAVAHGAKLPPGTFASQIIAKFSDLKVDLGMDALAGIPKEFFRSKVGRPPGSRIDGAAHPDHDGAESLQTRR